MRKHRSQMTSAEVKFVKSELRKLRKPHVISSLRLTPHAIEAMNDKFEPITYEEMVTCILCGDFFEVNDNGGGFRIAIRCTTSLNYATIVVLDAKTNTIVTTYKNKSCDDHDTLQWHEYTDELDVREMVQ